MIKRARTIDTVREKERELHFSEIKYSFIKHRLEEDSSKSLF